MLKRSRSSDPIVLSPDFDSTTETYTAAVANRIDEVVLTATKTNADATVAITNDDDTSTPSEAELNLSVGSNTVTVTVTAESGATKTYTITVTRPNVPPAPTDCPADTDWCSTMGVDYTKTVPPTALSETWGYNDSNRYGDLPNSMPFTHAGKSYWVTWIYQIRISSDDLFVLGPVNTSLSASKMSTKWMKPTPPPSAVPTDARCMCARQPKPNPISGPSTTRSASTHTPAASARRSCVKQRP